MTVLSKRSRWARDGGRHRRWRGDQGQAGGIEVLPFGFLVFVSGVLLMANVWGVIDAKMAVSGAAREATRAFVEHDDLRSAGEASARRAREALAAYGRNDSRASVAVPKLSHGFRRCGRVSITVSYEVPAISLPFIGGLGSLSAVSSTHSELIDPFRDGIAGAAQC